MELTPTEIVESLVAQARSKEWWLNSFSRGPKKRQDHEIAAKKRELAALDQASRIVSWAGGPYSAGRDTRALGEKDGSVP